MLTPYIFTISNTPDKKMLTQMNKIHVNRTTENLCLLLEIIYILVNYRCMETLESKVKFVIEL